MGSQSQDRNWIKSESTSSYKEKISESRISPSMFVWEKEDTERKVMTNLFLKLNIETGKVLVGKSQIEI